MLLRTPRDGDLDRGDAVVEGRIGVLLPDGGARFVEKCIFSDSFAREAVLLREASFVLVQPRNGYGVDVVGVVCRLSDLNDSPFQGRGPWPLRFTPSSAGPHRGPLWISICTASV